MTRIHPKYLMLMLALAAAACDAPTGVQLIVPDRTLEAVGDTAWLEAMVDGAGKPVRWESLDPGVVTVSSRGLATAVAPGSATVVARAGSERGEARVTVLPPVDVRVSDLAVVVDPNGEQGMRMRIRNLGGRGYYRLEYWALDDDGRKRLILWQAVDHDAPVGLDVVHETYVLEEPADWVVAFSREPLATEPVRTACIRRDGGPGCPSDLPDPPTVASVLLTPGAAVMNVGDLVQYTATAFDRGGNEITGRTVEWSTPSPDVIQLNESGLVRALAPGYGEVHATVDGVMAGRGLTVMTPEPEPEPEPQEPQPVESVIVRPEIVRRWVGQEAQLQVELRGGGHVLEGRPVEWSTADPAIATVDSTGHVRAVGHGVTWVTATSEGKYHYSRIESYTRPDGIAALDFRGLVSPPSPDVIDPSTPTIWVDSTGVAHQAYITVGSGELTMEWSDGEGTYTQRLELRTWLTEPYRVVDVSEYIDSGTVLVGWDYIGGTGDMYSFHSTTREGLRYLGRWSLPGELSVEQTVGSMAKRPYYFRLR